MLEMCVLEYSAETLPVIAQVMCLPSHRGGVAMKMLFLMVALFCLGESLMRLWLTVGGQLLVFKSYSVFLFCVWLQVLAAYRATQVCLTRGLFWCLSSFMV